MPILQLGKPSLREVSGLYSADHNRSYRVYSEGSAFSGPPYPRLPPALAARVTLPLPVTPELLLGVRVLGISPNRTPRYGGSDCLLSILTLEF